MNFLKKINNHPIVFLLSILILLLIYLNAWPYYTPQANLYYDSFKGSDDQEDVRGLHFYSNLNLLNLFSRGMSSGNAYFGCTNHSLTGKSLAFTFLSGTTEVSFDTNKKLYLHTVDLYSFPPPHEELLKTKEMLYALSKNQKTITCSVSIQPLFDFSDDYYDSNSMEVPAADMLKALEEYEEKKNTLVGVEEEEF